MELEASFAMCHCAKMKQETQTAGPFVNDRKI